MLSEQLIKSVVTNDVLESYIHCKYKGYLKLIGQSGIKSDYENLRIKLRGEVKRSALGKIYLQATDEQVLKDVVLGTSILEQDPLFVLNTSIENSHFSLLLDGIKKMSTKRQNYFFYAPILFYEGSRIHKEQRLFLDFFLLHLSLNIRR